MLPREQRATDDDVEIPNDLDPRYHKAFTAGWNCYDFGGHAGEDCPWFSGERHPWCRPNSKRSAPHARAWKAGFYAARYRDRSAGAIQRNNGTVLSVNDAALRTMGLLNGSYDADNVGENGERADGMVALGAVWLAMDEKTLIEWASRVYRAAPLRDVS